MSKPYTHEAAAKLVDSINAAIPNAIKPQPLREIVATILSCCKEIDRLREALKVAENGRAKAIAEKEKVEGAFARYQRDVRSGIQ